MFYLFIGVLCRCFYVRFKKLVNDIFVLVDEGLMKYIDKFC